MKLLYVGDVMAEAGLAVVERLLPDLRREQGVDVVIAQAENVTEGRGVSAADFKRLLAAGVDFCSGGNWSLYQEDILPALNDPAQPIVRPANYPAGTPGLGHKYLEKDGRNVLVVSLLGKIVGRDADKPVDNPLVIIDDILEKNDRHCDAIVVNFHGDFSSEKVVIGHYLDGRATMVVGDHWHVPTADARVLPGGTAHMTDVGMCGTLDSSLGVTYDSIIPRWRDDHMTRNVMASQPPYQFNAILVETNNQGQAASAQHIQKILDN